ncbi:MAG: hypothetical protein FWC50_04375 [Planctomycetaceae bacterium]|nr:hypothetical protein [Planctomycetaceae bacterium]
MTENLPTNRENPPFAHSASGNRSLTFVVKRGDFTQRHQGTEGGEGGFVSIVGGFMPMGGGFLPE